MKHDLTAFLVLAMASFASHGADQPPSAPSEDQPQGEQMRAHIDPETGELTSVPPPGAERAVEFERKLELIEEIRHPNGMTEWRFHGQANESMVAKTDAQGRLQTYCAEHGLEHTHVDAVETNDER